MKRARVVSRRRIACVVFRKAAFRRPSRNDSSSSSVGRPRMGPSRVVSCLFIRALEEWHQRARLGTRRERRASRRRVPTLFFSFVSASFRVFSATRLRPRPRTDAKTQSVAGDARRSARRAPRAGVPHGVAEPRGHREPRRVPVLPAEQHAVAPAHQPAPGAQLDVLFERRNRPGFRHA